MTKQDRKAQKPSEAKIPSNLNKREQQALIFLLSAREIAIFTDDTPTLSTVRDLTKKRFVKRKSSTQRFKHYDAGITIFALTERGKEIARALV